MQDILFLSFFLAKTVKFGFFLSFSYYSGARISLGYSDLSGVKEVLQITETTWDTELINCITSADALIDNILKFHGFTVPLSSPYPQNVVDASKYFAAYFFRERRAPADEVEKLYKRAQDFLLAYINAESGGTLKRI